MRSFLFIILTILFFGCLRNNRIPKDIITQNEMRKIMWDMMRADVYVSDFIMKDSTRNAKNESTILYEKIFALHSTTEDAFQRSLVFYETRPDLLKVITDSLRSDEKKAQNYQEYHKQGPDTTLEKMKLNKKLLKTNH